MSAQCWLFGYGSLIWRQGFPFRDSRRARIDGWVRRFYQGSHDHRGIPDDPGRVVTLIEAPGESCFGRAFLVDHDVLEHLDHREKNGYQRQDLTICLDAASVSGVTYFAPPDNEAFLGDASIEDMAVQIRRCAGESGRNLDYVLELAHALRRLGVDDPHVFDLEAFLKRQD